MTDNRRPCGNDQPHARHRIMVGVLAFTCPGVRAPAQTPQEGPQWSPDVSQALEAIAEALGAAVTPLASAFEDQRDLTMKAVTEFQTFYDLTGELLAFLDRAGVRPNWAHDGEMLERARDAYRRLSPDQRGTTDAPSSSSPST